MNPIATRLLNQQLICPQFSDPADVVCHMGAIQAQEYRMMRWAVAMRTSKPSSKAFKQAYDSGRIVRLHLMRGTWQLVASEDYWPLLQPVCPQGKGGDSRVDAERAVSVSGRMRRPAYVNSWSKRLPTRAALSKKILSGRWMPKASAWMITACLTTCAWLSCRAPCAAVTYCR